MTIPNMPLLYIITNRYVALPGFPRDLEHWLNLRGGNIIQKYLYTPNVSPIGQLEAEIWHFGPILDHIFGPSSGTLGPIPKKINLDNLPNMVGFRSKFQPPSIKSVGGVR